MRHVSHLTIFPRVSLLKPEASFSPLFKAILCSVPWAGELVNSVVRANLECMRLNPGVVRSDQFLSLVVLNLERPIHPTPTPDSPYWAVCLQMFTAKDSSLL